MDGPPYHGPAQPSCQFLNPHPLPVNPILNSRSPSAAVPLGNWTLVIGHWILIPLLLAPFAIRWKFSPQRRTPWPDQRPRKPPGASKDPLVRYLNVYETAPPDDARLARWIRQAAKLPGWGKNQAVFAVFGPKNRDFCVFRPKIGIFRPSGAPGSPQKPKFDRKFTQIGFFGPPTSDFGSRARRASVRPKNQQPSRKTGSGHPSPPVFMQISCFPAENPCFGCFRPPFAPFEKFVVSPPFLPFQTRCEPFSAPKTPAASFFACPRAHLPSFRPVIPRNRPPARR